ncbi:PadR family transcriptional regulator [Aldersonia kunmingensis]|uniref:PadR family transcriptional regulator n=1 Tax=Aldersonia kunmingensis TaxID=408066 RepID=UPI000A5E4FE2|nr:PadR family transcriptional regulator [Aldersonia kunmingensis]
MLAFNEELSGYDIKKWADWSIGHFYWSPSFSQVYSELKRLEKQGFATSRVQNDNGVRGRRTYRITDAGRAAVSKWSNEAPIDPPMLKHGVLLRIWLGHLNEPERLKEILQEHIAYVDKMRSRLAQDLEGAALEPAWAYPRIAMQWSERYYAAEHELALQLIKDIDQAEAALAQAKTEGKFPTPEPGRWREVEEHVQAEHPDED